MAALTEDERAVLDFEAAWFAGRTPKATAVPARFGHALVEHEQLVARLIRRPEALAYAPTTVRRLQRRRDRRLAHRRTQRVAGWDPGSSGGDFGSGPAMR